MRGCWNGVRNAIFWRRSKTMANLEKDEKQRVAEEVERAVARIQTSVLTVVFALLSGFGLFFMTAWLLIKNGKRVGAHLQLLGNYFPGYSVTWFGSVIGFFYAALVGGLIGWAIGTIYNKVVSLPNISRSLATKKSI